MVLPIKAYIRELKELHRSFISTLKNEDLTEVAQADVKFHDKIYEITDNKRLIQILSNLREQMYRYRFEYIKDEIHRRVLVDEHAMIIEGIENKDVDKAKKYMEIHIINQEKTIVAKITKDTEK